MSDIVFGTFDQIEVTCSNFNVHGSDLTLDSPARRKPGGPRLRRALVHDESDGLTLNFNADYPGGVSVSGPLALRGNVSLDLAELGHTAKIPPIGQGSGQVIIHTPVVLQDVLIALRREVKDLQEKVARLEARG
jgi:hypothetical protein